MLNEFLEMFLGAFSEFIPADYTNYYFFMSILAVGVLLILLLCVCTTVVVLVKGMLTIAFRGFKE